LLIPQQSRHRPSSRIDDDALAARDGLDNDLGVEGARLLADAPRFGTLASLSLYENRIGDGGDEALAASRHLTHLRTLRPRTIAMSDNATTAALPVPEQAGRGQPVSLWIDEIRHAGRSNQRLGLDSSPRDGLLCS
jgi:hypothetical protein